MKSANCDKLMEKATVNNEVELYKIINSRLDEILSNAYNKEETLRALLCAFESKTNRTVFFSIMSICFAVLLGGISLISSLLPVESFVGEIILIIGLLIVAILIMIACKVGDKEEEKARFILSVIKERHEDLKNGKMNEMIQHNENEKVYYVTVNPKQ